MADFSQHATRAHARPDFKAIMERLRGQELCDLWNEKESCSRIVIEKTIKRGRWNLSVVFLCSPCGALQISVEHSCRSVGLHNCGERLFFLLPNKENVVFISDLWLKPDGTGEMLLYLRECTPKTLEANDAGLLGAVSGWLDRNFSEFDVKARELTVVSREAIATIKIPIGSLFVRDRVLEIDDFFYTLSEEYGGDANMFVRSAFSRYARSYARTASGLLMDVLIGVSRLIFNVDGVYLTDWFESNSGITSDDIKQWYDAGRTTNPAYYRKLDEFMRRTESKYGRRPTRAGFYGMWGFERAAGDDDDDDDVYVSLDHYTPTRLKVGNAAAPCKFIF